MDIICCVYLITYLGNNLEPKTIGRNVINPNVCPQFYIGSTLLDKIIFHGYRGSVSSKQYGPIWKQELISHPELFVVEILSYWNNQREAVAEELRLQLEACAVKNPNYVNKAYARKNFAEYGVEPWNKGLKRETSEGVEKQAQQMVGRYSGETYENSERVRKITDKAREHYVAHQLLSKIYPKHSGLALACVVLSADGNGNRIGNRRYEWIRTQYSKLSSMRQKGQSKENCEWRKRNADKMRGQNRHNSERYRKSSVTQKGRTKESHKSIARVTELLSGRSKDDYEYLARIGKINSERMSGKTAQNTDYVANMAETLRGRTKENFQHLMEHSIRMSGRTKETHLGVARSAEKQNKLSPEQRIELVFMKKAGMSNRTIYEYFKEECGIDFSYSSISSIFSRHKHLVEINILLPHECTL